MDALQAFAREEWKFEVKSFVITGASNLGQLRANLAAVDAIEKLTPEVLARIDAITLPLAA